MTYSIGNYMHLKLWFHENKRYETYKQDSLYKDERNPSKLQ